MIVHNLFKSNLSDPVAQNDGQTEATITNPFTFTNNNLASCFGYKLDTGDSNEYSLTSTSANELSIKLWHQIDTLTGTSILTESDILKKKQFKVRIFLKDNTAAYIDSAGSFEVLALCHTSQ